MQVALSQANASDDRLRFERVRRAEPIPSARFTDDGRAHGLMTGDRIVWFWG